MEVEVYYLFQVFQFVDFVGGVVSQGQWQVVGGDVVIVVVYLQ